MMGWPLGRVVVIWEKKTKKTGPRMGKKGVIFPKIGFFDVSRPLEGRFGCSIVVVDVFRDGSGDRVVVRPRNRDFGKKKRKKPALEWGEKGQKLKKKWSKIVFFGIA